MKEPIPGAVKTRLGRSIGDETAAQLYRCFQSDLLERFVNVVDQLVIAYHPVTLQGEQYFAQFANQAKLWQQPESSLGQRMFEFFDSFPGPSVIIGSDSPSLPTQYVHHAFELLQQHEIVLGPATDGGYYLVGQSVSFPEMFVDIEFSQPAVLNETVQRINQHNRSLALLSPWYDIDENQDLTALYGHLQAMKSAGQSDLPRLTFDYLQSMFES